MPRSTLLRALSRVTLLLQLLLPTVVSIADARLERDAMSARAYTHVEATTSADCVRTHKADCALCQHLSTPGTKASKPELPAIRTGSDVAPASPSLAYIAAQSRRPALPRAPPQA